MENQIVKYVSNQMQIELSPSMVKKCLVKGTKEAVTDEEVTLFMNLCAYRQLNPFLNEAYLVKYSGSPAQIIVSYDVHMKRAGESIHYKGFKAGVIVIRDGEEVDKIGSTVLPNEDLFGGWCSVKRDDYDEPIVSRVMLSDYIKYKEDGKTPQSTWKKPAMMIVKVAKSQAHRDAFKKELGGLYTDAEGATIGGEIIDITPLKTVAEPQRKSDTTPQGNSSTQNYQPQPAPDKKISEPQVKRFYAIVKNAAGVTEEIARIILDSKVPNNRDTEGHFLWSNISKEIYDELCGMFEKGTWQNVYQEILVNAAQD